LILWPGSEDDGPQISQFAGQAWVALQLALVTKINFNSIGIHNALNFFASQRTYNLHLIRLSADRKLAIDEDRRALRAIEFQNQLRSSKK
jgi:hypothetical protein